MSPKTNEPKIAANNKRANFEYFLLEKYTAGIVLDRNRSKVLQNGQSQYERCLLLL